MSINILLKTGNSLVSDAVIGKPHWNIYCNRPMVFKHTDFPPAFGPEITSMRLSLLSSASRGTIVRLCRLSDCANSGCLAVRSTRRSSVDIIGFEAPFSNAQRAFARSISTVAIKCSVRSTSAISARNVSVKAVKMRTISLRSSYSNSRSRLFNSTTSAGST